MYLIVVTVFVGGSCRRKRRSRFEVDIAVRQAEDTRLLTAEPTGILDIFPVTQLQYYLSPNPSH
jgi:hypothetical protein